MLVLDSFSAQMHTGLGPIQLPVKWGTGFFSGDKAARA
jgi:hypothetical protein